jgi:hypothetical protein
MQFPGIYYNLNDIVGRRQLHLERRGQVRAKHLLYVGMIGTNLGRTERFGEQPERMTISINCF